MSRKQTFSRSDLAPDVETLEECTAEGPAARSTFKERRRHARSNATQHAAVHSTHGSLICDLVELSTAGARLLVVSGSVPNKGDIVRLALLDGTQLNGTAVWKTGTDIGISFETHLHDIEDRLGLESLGRAYFAQALKLQQTSRNN